MLNPHAWGRLSCRASRVIASKSTKGQQYAHTASSAATWAPRTSLQRQPPTAAEQVVKPLTICVTGASGFVGTRCTERLLALGHTVHALCLPRELNGEGVGVAHLQALPGANERLRLFPSDITQPRSCDAALAGADACLHLAAVVKLVAGRQEQAAMVDTALRGTRALLDSVSGSRSVRQVVMASSIAACVGDNWERGRDHVFSEADWAIEARVGHNTYNYAKRESERLAQQVQAGQSRWGLTVLNPGVVLGPVSLRAHALTSPGMLLGIMTGKPTPTMDLFTFFCDVDDVAAAASSAVALGPAACPGRHVLVSQSTSLHSIYDTCVSLGLPQPDSLGWVPPGKLAAPVWLLRALPSVLEPLGTDAGLLRGTCAKPVRVDASHAAKTLGVSSWVPWEQVVEDTAHSLAALGLLQSVQHSQQLSDSGRSQSAVDQQQQVQVQLRKHGAYREMP